MDYDLIFVVGAILTALSIPAVLSAFADGRAPRAAAITIMIGGTLLIMGLGGKPGGFALNDIPDTFYRVFARYLD